MGESGEAGCCKRSMKRVFEHIIKCDTPEKVICFFFFISFFSFL